MAQKKPRFVSPETAEGIFKMPGSNIDPKAVILNEIILRNIDRTPKDIRSWRDAHINAESIYYPNRTRLYDLYEDVRLDPHLTGIINKRLDAVLNKSLRFKKDDKQVEGMEPLFKTVAFRKMLRSLLMTQFWGITGFEFIPGKDFFFEEINRKHIKPEMGIITVEQSDYAGIDYSDLSNVWVIGDRRDYGLYLQCAPYALYKKGNMGDWAQYVEIFGQPMRVYRYDAFDKKIKDQLFQSVDEAGGSLSIMIPKQVDFDIKDGKISNGDGQLQERLKNACNDEMSIIVLGNTETTNSTHGGSNAKAQEHGKQQMEITKADMQYVIDQLNTDKFRAICKSYGYPADQGEFEFEKEIDLVTLSQKVIIDSQIAKIVPIGDDYWYDTYNIPKPDDYDALKKKMEAEKQVALNPPINNPSNPTKKPTDPIPHAKKPNLTAWQNLRAALADFFDPAPLK